MDWRKLFSITKDIIINQHSGRCFICNELLTKDISYHHISRIPPLVVATHDTCHQLIENDETGKWNFMKPKFTAREAKLIKKLYDDAPVIKQLSKEIIELKGLSGKVMHRCKTLSKKAKVIREMPKTSLTVPQNAPGTTET